MVSPSQVVPAAPAPLASIRDRVTQDWINDQAAQRAKAAATQIAAKASGNVSLADAAKSVNAALPPVQPISARRLQIANAQGQVLPAMRVLFSLAEGKSRMAPVPGGGFVVVKVTKITPGNAMIAPALIGQVEGELSQATSQDYAQQFMADIKRELKVKRNDSAINAFKQRLLNGGG